MRKNPRQNPALRYTACKAGELMKLRVLGCVMFSIRAWAQDPIPPAPSEPLLPTNSQDCVDFSNAYQKFLDKIGEAKTKCINENLNEGYLHIVAAPSSCVEGGWSGNSSTT